MTLAYGINDLGVVVGYYLTSLNSGGDCCGVHGFQYRSGKFSELDVPGYDDTVVIGINNLGGITGYTAHHNDVSWSGFTGSTGGGYSVFTAVGDNKDENGGTFPSAINDWGTVVGHANGWKGYGVFVGWERLANGQMVTISDPLANTTPDPSWGPECDCFGGTVPGGINDFGTVAGIYSTAAKWARASSPPRPDNAQTSSESEINKPATAHEGPPRRAFPLPALSSTGSLGKADRQPAPTRLGAVRPRPVGGDRLPRGRRGV